MNPKSTEVFIPGPAGRLEGKYYKNPKFGSPVAIVLHHKARTQPFSHMTSCWHGMILNPVFLRAPYFAPENRLGDILLEKNMTCYLPKKLNYPLHI